MADLAQVVMERIEALGKISDEPSRLTRTFCSPAMRRTNDLVASWMREAGMEVREDAVGNLIGHYSVDHDTAESQPGSEGAGSRILLLGSHLDTVRDAGKFDGPLGVLIAIACVEELRSSKSRLPFAIEVVGFADEEGVRYQSTYLGSRALAGTLTSSDLERPDASGVTMAEAIRNFGGNPEFLGSARLKCTELIGYAEVHIEQGPVLEQKKLAVGVVTAIAGQTRARLSFLGRAGHAGTTPMSLRRDALCAAAEFTLAVESLGRCRSGLVATVGEITALPGASNVIPGKARLSLDVRHAEDRTREAALSELLATAEQIVAQRGLALEWQTVHESRAIACDSKLSGMLAEAVEEYQDESLMLPSGAGHDAVALAAIAPVAMLFVRCKGGISHHPEESVAIEDVRVALRVANSFLQKLAREFATKRRTKL